MKVCYPINLRVSLKDKEIKNPDFHERLKNDKDLWDVFHSNIAICFIAFYDMYKVEKNKKYITKEDFYHIANNASTAFLELWTSE